MTLTRFVSGMEESMSPFLKAFYAGMSAPVALFAPPAAYNTFVKPIGAAEGLSIAGTYLTAAFKANGHGGRTQ